MSKSLVEEALSSAGIEVNGNNPWDIRILNEAFYERILAKGSLGLGESYMDGWWECDALDEFFYRILRTDLMKNVRSNWKTALLVLSSRLSNRQSRRRAFNIGKAHYDKGNDLYKAMLDRKMVYSCGYWKDATTLDEAQEAKLELICRKLHLQPGMKVLDIGCGWGSFAKFAAEKYDAHVIGVTVSQEQAELGRKLCDGLPVEIRLQDYRELDEPFDHIVSVGMFEHVGHKNYRTYMKVINRCLCDEGLFLLHTIGENTSVISTDPWVNKYIFPDGILPSVRQIGASIEGLFLLEDWHNFGADYEKTLLAWHRNFDENWETLQDRYDERFYRMWKYYLLSFAGGFRARRLQLWQIVLSKNGVPGGYQSVR